MEKRLIITIVLSMLVLFGWSAIMSKMYPPAQTPQATTVPAVSPVPAATAAASKQPADNSETINILPKETVSTVIPLPFSTEHAQVLLSQGDATITSLEFPQYRSGKLELKNGLFIANIPNAYTLRDKGDDRLVFQSKDNQKTIIKTLVFSKDKYDLKLEVKILNTTPNDLILDVPVVLGTLDFASANPDSRFQDVTVVANGKTLHLAGNKETSQAGLKFIALRNRYFTAIAQPETTGSYEGFVKKLNNNEWSIGIMSKLSIPARQENVQSYHIYLGPIDLKKIETVKSDWTIVVYYGFFDIISHGLLQVLDFLHGLTRSWGWAIILLSILVYFILYPLSLKQMNSMKQMQELQPKIQAIRDQYKDNPQKLNQEYMELLKKHKVNPFGGCLPFVLQIPVFFALYQALMRSISLKGAPFLWIKDLSEPDKLFSLPGALPFIGQDFNILPIIMAALMMVQQKLSMKYTAGGNEEQQKIMAIIFPIMFVFIFYHMPSGLVLYWSVNSLLMLLQQMKMYKKA